MALGPKPETPTAVDLGRSSLLVNLRGEAAPMVHIGVESHVPRFLNSMSDLRGRQTHSEEK